MIPEGAGLDHAATLPMNGLTAMLGLDELALSTGDTLYLNRVPEDFNSAAWMMVGDSLTGRTDRTPNLEWPILYTSIGGLSDFFENLGNDYGANDAIPLFIALPAGIARMPRGKFHIYTFLGSWPWCFALAYFGMKLGENWRALGKYFHQFDAIIGVLFIAAIAWFLWSHWQNRLRPDET